MAKLDPDAPIPYTPTDVDPDSHVPYTRPTVEPDLAAIALSLLEMSVALGVADGADVNRRLAATDALTALELTKEL